MPENIVTAAWPDELKSVYEIKTSDPVEGGPDGIDNKPHKDLEKRTDYLLLEIARVAGLVPGTDEYEKLIEYLASLDVGILEGRIDYVREMLRAMGLYTDSKFWFEYFEPGEAEADLFDREVTEARAGSDCIDLTDTKGLKVGAEYHLHDSEHSETVVLLEVLDNERFRSVDPILYTYGPDARLTRTKWEFKPTEGVAIPGAWYYSKEMQLGYSTEKTLIVRRQDNAGTLAVYSRGAGQTWKEIPWEWKRPVGDTGYIDVEYPIRGNEGLEIKILCEGERIVIHWMAAIAGKTNLRGIHNGPEQPLNVSPLEGATDVSEIPTLQADVYRSPNGTAQKNLEVQISESPEFGDLTHYAQNLPAGTSYAVPEGILQPDTLYYYRVRFIDAEGTVSMWSEPTSFRTSLVFLDFRTPRITAPQNGAADITDEPTFECTAFEISGVTDTHAATQWQVREASQSWGEPVYDVLSTTDKTSLTLPSGLLRDGKTMYYVRCRHESGEHGLSEWSAESSFTTVEVFATAYGVAVVSRNNIMHIDARGNVIRPTKTDFDAHAAWGGIEDVVADGQDMVKIPKFYIKRGTGPVGSDAEGKECWWISDKPYPGFKLHPSFRLGSIELDYFLIGKYTACTTDANTKAGSLPGQAPIKTSLGSVPNDWDVMKTLARARGNGWHAWDLQELGAIQYLFLIEYASFDAQGLISTGNKTGKYPHTGFQTGSTDVIYRGIHELWGTTWSKVDGIETDANSVISLFSEDGNREFVSTGIVMKNPGSYPTTFHKGGLFDSVFIRDEGVQSTANAIAPDAQVVSGSATGSYQTATGGMPQEEGDAGLWYLRNLSHGVYAATRVAKR